MTMKTLAAVLTLCLILLSAPLAAAGEAATVKTTHAVRDAENSTLTQHGSGTVIQRDAGGFTVLSCAHVVEHRGKYGRGKLTVSTAGGKTYPAKLLRYDRDRDLSVMRVEANDADVGVALLARQEAYAPGLRLVKYGHAGGGDLRASEGVASRESSTSNGYKNLIATAESSSGDSGGGVYRKSDARLIGVVWGGLRGKGLRAVRIEDVREFLLEADDAGKAALLK